MESRRAWVKRYYYEHYPDGRPEEERLYRELERALPAEYNDPLVMVALQRHRRTVLRGDLRALGINQGKDAATGKAIAVVETQLTLVEVTPMWMRRITLSFADQRRVYNDIVIWAEANPGEITDAEAYFEELLGEAGL